MRKVPEGKYVWTVTVGEKGQFVIPKQARELCDIKPGDNLILLGDVEKGIAIPHARIKGLDEVAVVIGISRLPIDFGGEEKTRVFFLVLAPDERPQEHIQTLSSIARLCMSDVFVRMLTNARTPDEVYQLFFD